MIPIFICEDDPRQRDKLEKLISDYIVIENLDMEIMMATENPEHIVAYLLKNPKKTGVYFLDIDLSHKMNGFSLASKIRETDTFGTIIFVTMHSEMASLTFTHKLEAMDFIVKNQLEDFEKRVRECIQLAYSRFLNHENSEKQFYQLKTADRIRMIPIDNIMFFESSTVPHKLILHLYNGQIEFRGSIRELLTEQGVAVNFFRCHKSYVVNKLNIESIDRKMKIIHLVNGETCLISIRALKILEHSK